VERFLEGRFVSFVILLSVFDIYVGVYNCLERLMFFVANENRKVNCF